MVNESEVLSLYERHCNGIKSSGESQYVALCPFHNDTHHSFSFNIANTQHNCFACGESGNAIKFAKVMGEDPTPFYSEEYKNNGTVSVTKKQLNRKDTGKEFPSPKIVNTAELMEKALEYCDNASWDSELKNINLVGISNGHLTFPYFKGDECVAIHHHKSYPHWEGDGICKWYNEWDLNSMDKTKPLFIVEGERDVNSMGRRGFNAVSQSAGASSVPKYLPMGFKDFPSLINLYDNDKWGRDGAIIMAKAIKKGFGINSYIGQWREGLPIGYDAFDDKTGEEIEYAIKNMRRYNPEDENIEVGELRTMEIDSKEENKIPSELDPAKSYEMSDSGNAELFVDMFGDKCRFNHTSKKWNIFNKVYWKPDTKQFVNELAKLSAQERQKRTLNIESGHDKKINMAFAIRSEDYSKINAMLNAGKSLLKIATTHEDWNVNPLLFQCSNTVLDLNELKQINPNPDFMISQYSDVEYDIDANCPIFYKSLREWMQDDMEMVDFIKRMMGYFLTGLTNEQCMFIFVGNGANGKSVLLDVFAELYGDYHKHTAMDVFMFQHSRSNSNDLARLHDARVVTANESADGKKIDEERIKTITGGDLVTARMLYEEHSTFRSKIKLVMATNTLPKISDYTEGLWRRMRIVKFDRQFLPEERDTDLITKLKEEMSGILNFALEGLEEYNSIGLNPPDKVLRATQEYRNESDFVAQFIEECIEENLDNRVPSKLVYQSFLIWYEENYNEKPITQNAFSRRMSSHGFKSDKIGGKKLYLGIKLMNQD